MVIKTSSVFGLACLMAGSSVQAQDMNPYEEC